MKKFGALFLTVCLMLTMLAGCNEAEVNQSYKNEIAAAAKKLNDTYTNYIIETTIEFGQDGKMYIEVVKGDDIYTEYSVDEDGRMGMIPYGSDDTISYAMVDWTHDGTYYGIGSYEDEDVFIKFPDSFAKKYAHDREMLFVNRLLAGAKEITVRGDMQIETVTGLETYKSYKIIVSSSTMSEILGYDSVGVYKSMKESEKSGSNITKLCDFYLEELEPTLACSDGTIIVGIDQNGILKFMSFELGGLGTRMYMSKVVVDVSNQNVRETPDFTKSVPLSTTMTEMAEFIAPYKTHDEIVNALNTLYSDQYQEALEGLT